MQSAGSNGLTKESHVKENDRNKVIKGNNIGKGIMEENTWLFLESSFIHKSPSRIQLKMTITQELKARESIHDFVIRLGSKLKLDGRSILAATIYINRYYMRLPISSSKYYVASAALTISCKLNDTYRQPDKVALQACNIKNPNPAKPFDEQSEYFWTWRDQLLFREELILKTLNFDLNLDLPYAIRDDLAAIDEEDDSLFVEKKADILKNTVSLIEILSSLPVLVSFDMYTVFGTLLLVILHEGKKMFEDDSLKLPRNYLVKHLRVNHKLCFECYQYILKLLKYSQEGDPRFVSNKSAFKRLRSLNEDTFKHLANEG